MAAALTASLAFAAPAAASKPKIAFTSTIGGSTTDAPGCPSPETDAWPLVGVDPKDPDRLRALYQRAGIAASVFARSEDGGRTWTRRTVSDATACAGGSPERDASVNPLFSVGAQGSAYYGQSWIGHRDGNWAYGVDVHRLSPTAGRGAPADSFYAQNAAVAASPSDPLSVSMTWTQFDEVPNPFTYTTLLPSRTLFSSSADGGENWEAPRVISSSAPGSANINPRLVHATDGALVAIFDRVQMRDAPGFVALGEDLPLEVFATRSADGGRTWSEPEVIGTLAITTVSDPDHGPGEHSTPAGSAKPDLAAGPDGSVVAVWADGSSTVGGAIGRPDGGRFTWSPLPGAPSARTEYIQPAAAFDGAGNLGVFFYDFGDDRPGDEAWSVTPRLAVLGRRAHTWTVTALSAPFDLHRTNSCRSETGLADPLTSSCEHAVDFMAVGVYQDVVGLPRGFGVGYTVGPPVAVDGFTDARYARVLVR